MSDSKFLNSIVIYDGSHFHFRQPGGIDDKNPITPEEYKFALVSGVGIQVMEDLKNIHCKAKHYVGCTNTREGRKKCSWEVKQLWLFASEKTFDMRRLFNQIEFKRDELIEPETMLLPDEPFDSSVTAKISEIMKHYSELLQVLMQYEAQWQTHISFYRADEQEILRLGEYKEYHKFTKPRSPKKTWDGPGFRQADFYLMHAVRYRVGWLISNPLRKHWYPINDCYKPKAPSPKPASEPTRKYEPRPTHSSIYSRPGNIYPWKTSAFYDCNPMRWDVQFQNRFHPSLTPWPKERQIKYIRERLLEPCPQDCLCYHCHIASLCDHEKSCDDSMDSDDSDIVYPGMFELVKKEKKSPLSGPSQDGKGNTHTNKSQPSQPDPQHKLFFEQLARFEADVANTRDDRSIFGQAFKFLLMTVFKWLRRIWRSYFATAMKVHPMEGKHDKQGYPQRNAGLFRNHIDSRDPWLASLRNSNAV